MLREIGIGVIGSIIGMVVWAIGSKLYLYIRYYKDSEYSGLWVDIIPYISEDMPEKHDEIVIRHNKRTNVISGTIKRTSPHSQRARTWLLNGVIDDGYLIASFWHNGPQKSNGCVYTRLTGDNKYEGYYLEEHNGVIDKTPITLMKR